MHTTLHAFFDPVTSTMSYVLSDNATRMAAIAHRLYHSIHRILELPGDTRLFVCHDYPPAGRTPRYETTVAEQRAQNIHVHDGITEEQFVAMREARDATLEVPSLILPSLQVNVRAGQLPPPDDNGVSYLRIPLNVLAAKLQAH